MGRLLTPFILPRNTLVGLGELGRLDTKVVLVAVEQDALALALSALGRLNPLAPTSSLPHGLDEADGAVLDVGTVVLAHDLLDGLGGLVGVVEGDGGDVVVEDVGLDDAVEEVAADEAELAVNSRGGTTDEVPLLSGVVGERGVGVLEVGDGNEPVVDPEVGEEVPDEHVGPAEGVAEVDEGGDGDGDADVGNNDPGSLTLVIEGRAGVEVVDTGEPAVLLALATALALLLVVVVAGDVGHEVVGPADELLTEKVDEGVDGGLLGQLGKLVSELADAGSLLLAGAGNEDHVALDVAGGLVVLAVGELPREVGDEKGGVEDPADGVVNQPGRRESLVTALVGKNPETGAEETLHEGVQAPENDTGSLGGNVLGSDIVVPEVEGDAEVDAVADDIGQAAKSRTLVAVLGDGITDVLDGEVGDLELVAVGVDQLAELGLVDLDVVGGQRGERGVGGRTLKGRVEGRGIGGSGVRVVGGLGIGPAHGRLAARGQGRGDRRHLGGRSKLIGGEMDEEEEVNWIVETGSKQPLSA